jgi:tetratricopeptide (TPR) repeat protein
MAVARQLLSPLGAALALCAAALFVGDGSDSGTLPWIGGAAVAVAVALAATREVPQRLVALLPLGALTVWCAASIAWSIEPDRTWEYANRTAVYLVFALVGAYIAGRTGELALGLAALLGAVCVWALAAKVFPALYDDYGRIARLRAPVDYWNALALLGDIALPLGLWLAGRKRAAGTLLVYGWLVAIALTYSRGGVVVAVVIVAAWIALSGAWIAAMTTLVAAGIPAAAAIGAALWLPGVTSNAQLHSTRADDGLIFGGVLLGGALVAALLARIPDPDPTRELRAAAATLVSVIAVVALIFAAVHAEEWWDEFTSPTTPGLSSGPGRFVEAGSNYRWAWWQQAWQAFEENRVAGTGAGSFRFTNLRYRDTSLDAATEPHNLPLQFLTETGAVGAALFGAAALALVVFTRRRSDAELALSLALPAYLLHGLVDFDWDFLAVTAPVFLVAGALAVRAGPERRPFSFPAALAASGVGLAVLASLFTVWLGNHYANEAALASSPAHAITLAKRARSLNPLSVDPIFTQAVAEQRLRRLTRARNLLLRATLVQPRNAETWYRLGAFDLQLRCPREALDAFEIFYQLNPQDRGVAEKDKALNLVNAGGATC